MVRTLLERTTRDWVFRRRLPGTLGGAKIFVSPSAGLRYLFRSMAQVDPKLCGLATDFVRKGNVVWDVGANLGLFSFAAAHLSGATGHVLSFEPDLWLVQLLRRSAAIQPTTAAPVRVVPVAVAETMDLRSFSIALRSRAGNFLAGYGSTQTGGVREEQTVVSVSLDWLAKRLPTPDIIKIDVEGAELAVLEGGLDLLEAKRPVIICEVASESSRQVTALLRSKKYSIFDGDRAARERVELDAAPWNTLAIPSEQRSDGATRV